MVDVAVEDPQVVVGFGLWWPAGDPGEGLCILGREEAPPLTVVRRKVTDAVSSHLRAGLVEIGDLDELPDGALGFVAWGVDPETAITRVEREWDELGRLPDLGQLFWLCNTAAGDAVARAALEEAGE